jgi:hypothetical protein
MTSPSFRLGFPVDPGNDDDWGLVLVRSSGSRPTFGWAGNEHRLRQELSDRGAARAAEHFPSRKFSRRYLHFSAFASRQLEPAPLWPRGNSDTAACTLAYVQTEVPNDVSPVILISCDCRFESEETYRDIELLPVTEDSRSPSGLLSLKRKWYCATACGLPVVALILFARDAEALGEAIRVQVTPLATNLFLPHTQPPFADRPLLVSVRRSSMPNLASALGLEGHYFEHVTGREITIATEKRPEQPPGPGQFQYEEEALNRALRDVGSEALELPALQTSFTVSDQDWSSKRTRPRRVSPGRGRSNFEHSAESKTLPVESDEGSASSQAIKRSLALRSTPLLSSRWLALRSQEIAAPCKVIMFSREYGRVHESNSISLINGCISFESLFSLDRGDVLDVRIRPPHLKTITAMGIVDAAETTHDGFAIKVKLHHIEPAGGENFLVDYLLQRSTHHEANQHANRFRTLAVLAFLLAASASAVLMNFASTILWPGKEFSDAQDQLSTPGTFEQGNERRVVLKLHQDIQTTTTPTSVMSSTRSR